MAKKSNKKRLTSQDKERFERYTTIAQLIINAVLAIAALITALKS